MTEGMCIRPLTSSDIPSVMNLVTEAGWPHRQGDVVDSLELGYGYLCCAVPRGDVLGAGAWWPIGEQAARLGLIVVSVQHRGRGIGRRLVEHLVAETGTRSISLLATRAGQSLYQTLGFAIVEAYAQHQGHYTAKASPDARIRLASQPDHPTILALDNAATNLDRRNILMPLIAEGRVRVIVESTVPVAYAIEREFGRGSVVGPIVARSELEAMALFDASARPGFIRVDCPVYCRRLARHLECCGLENVDVGHEMLRGEKRMANQMIRSYAMASHAWG